MSNNKFVVREWSRVHLIFGRHIYHVVCVNLSKTIFQNKMPKFNEETLSGWTRPASETEENKLTNAERLVREAISEHNKLNKISIRIFGQGSYANDTNVRLNSDIDINV